MEYSISKLASLSGVTTRTLRYYDEIGLLKPTRVNSSGIRIYSQREVDTLQQILFYKELEMPLEKINKIINAKGFNEKDALYEHKKNLLEKKDQIIRLLNNVDNTIKSIEGEYEMSNKEKFEAFKDEIIRKNEQKFGKEIREKYGDDKVQESYNKIKNMNKEQYDEATYMALKINNDLRDILKENDVTSDKAKELVKLHKKWLNLYGEYSDEMHMNLGQMYVDDERFTAYYDNASGSGASKFLRDAIVAFYGGVFNEEMYRWQLEK